MHTRRWETHFVLPVLFVGFLALPIVFLALRDSSRKKEQRAAAARLGLFEIVDAGLYVSGHPARTRSASATVGCDHRDFVFLADDGAELFRIPRWSPTSIDVVDATKHTETTMQRVTVGRVALLGVYALAFPKTETKRQTHEKYIVGVSWNYNGVELTTSFAFTDGTAANRFAGAVANQRINAALAPHA